MRRWIAPAPLLIIGVIVGTVGYVLLDRAAAFPGSVEKVDAKVLDDRAASCDWEVPRVPVSFELGGEERVADLSEDDCAPARTQGQTIQVYVLSEWPQYVGACRYCLPVDADDAPGLYAYELGGFGLTALGFFTVLAGLVLSAVAAVRGRRSRIHIPT